MRKLFLLIFVSFFLSGCIEIVESIRVNDDTSGSIEYRVKTLESNSWLGNLAGMFNNSIEDQIRKEAGRVARILSEQEGISHVEYNPGSFAGDFYLRFDFENSGDFNRALYQVGGYKKTCFSPGYLKIGHHKVKKRNLTPWLKRYLKKEKIELSSKMISDMVLFSTEIQLPEEARRVKAENLLESNEGSTVMQKITFTEMLKENKSTRLKICY